MRRKSEFDCSQRVCSASRRAKRKVSGIGGRRSSSPKGDSLKPETFRRCLVAVIAVVALATSHRAFSNPTETDPFGVGRFRPCEETVGMSLSEAVDSLHELDGRIRAVPPEKAALFSREEPHIFDTHDPTRMGALFGDPYYELWTLHHQVRELAEEVQHFAEAQRRPLSVAEELGQTGRLLLRFTSTMGVLTQAVTGRAREGGPDSPRLVTDEQIDVYRENLQGIAMYVAEYGRCRATLEARQQPDVAKRRR